VAFSDRDAEWSDGWTRWLWVPILVPGLVLAWLAWRAVVVEQRLLEKQVAESRVRLAGIVAGDLTGAARELRMAAQMDLERWALDAGLGIPRIPPPWFDAVQVRSQDLALPHPMVRDDSLKVEGLWSTFLLDPGADPDTRLTRLEEWILETLHASDALLPEDLDSRVERGRREVAPYLSTRPHWKNLLDDQSEALRRRSLQVKVRREASTLFDSLGRVPQTRLVPVHDRIWLVLAPPDLPRGMVAVGRFSEVALRAKLLRREILENSTSTDTSGKLILGLQDASGVIFGISGQIPARLPDEKVAVPGGFPNWSVVVWSAGHSEDAARFRSVLVSALLGLSLLVLVGATAMATRSIRAQRDLLAMKTDFVSNVSHELKTPLTSIALYAELLAGGRAGERSGEFGQTILREARRLQGLIEGLLSFARGEAGAAILRKEPLNLGALVREASRSFEGLAARRRIDFSVDVANAWVAGDSSLLRPAIENLVDNAFKYGKDGGFVHVSLAAEGPDVVLRVRDNGPGIPQEDQPRVFERFYRGGGELTRTVAGTGLGLAIVRRNVEFHGGEVVLKSDEGRGTTFEIRLPLVEEPNA
jgi:signal transduction histidine kinase